MCQHPAPGKAGGIWVCASMSHDTLHVHINALHAPFIAYVHIPALSAGLMFPGKVMGQHSSVFSHRHEVLHVCSSLCIRGHTCWPVTLRGFSVSHCIYLSKGCMHRHMGHGLTVLPGPCVSVLACSCACVCTVTCIHGSTTGSACGCVCTAAGLWAAADWSMTLRVCAWHRAMCACMPGCRCGVLGSALIMLCALGGCQHSPFWAPVPGSGCQRREDGAGTARRQAFFFINKGIWGQLEHE